MSNSKKVPESNRHHGGPGSSHQRPDLPDPTKTRPGPIPGEPTNSTQSDVSGGGGIRDTHHTHEPLLKGGKSS